MSDPMAGIPETPDASAPRNRARDARLIAIGVFAVLLIWFALANLQDVRIHFWVTSTHAPLIVVIIISGVLGAGVAELAGRFARRRKAAVDTETPF
jgi:uncharacterized integral membrane protein